MKPLECLDAVRVIQKIRDGDADETLDCIYKNLQPKFLRWAKWRFEAYEGDFQDAFQDAVIAFYFKVKSGKLVQLDCSLKTFLFGIGYRKLQKLHRKLNRIVWKDEIDTAIEQNAQIRDFVFENFDMKDRFEQAMAQLDATSRDILTRWFDGQSEEQIAYEMGYKVSSIKVKLTNSKNELRANLEKLKEL